MLSGTRRSIRTLLAPPCGAASDLAGASRPRSARPSSSIGTKIQNHRKTAIVCTGERWPSFRARLSFIAERIAAPMNTTTHLRSDPRPRRLEKELSDTAMANDAPASLRLRSRPWVCVSTSFSLPKLREGRSSLANALIGGERGFAGRFLCCRMTHRRRRRYANAIRSSLPGNFHRKPCLGGT
jgi:hypothetical protein